MVVVKAWVRVDKKAIWQLGNFWMMFCAISVRKLCRRCALSLNSPEGPFWACSIQTTWTWEGESPALITWVVALSQQSLLGSAHSGAVHPPSAPLARTTESDLALSGWSSGICPLARFIKASSTNAKPSRKFPICVRHSKSEQTYFATWGRAAVWAARRDGRGDGLTCNVMVHRSLIRTIRIEAAFLTLPVPCIRPLAQIVERRIRYRRRHRGWRARAGGRGGRGWRGARRTRGWC